MTLCTLALSCCALLHVARAKSDQDYLDLPSIVAKIPSGYYNVVIRSNTTYWKRFVDITK